MSVATANAIDRFPGPTAPSIVQLLSWGLRQHEYWNDLSARYGSAFRVRWPFLYEGRVVCFTSPDAARQVLRLPPEVAHAGEAYKLLELTGGPHSVIVLDEDEHLRMRKLVLSPLHGARLERWKSFAEQRTLEDIATWPVGEVFALRPVVERITMSVILKIVFGVRDPRRSDEMYRLAPKLFDVSVPVGLGAFTKYAKLDLGPWSPWGAYRRRRGRFDELIFAEISERRAELANAPGDGEAEERGDLLSMLLEARDEQGRPMSDAELRDQLVTMLLAGHETTATSLAWAIERLLRNRGVLRELVERLDEGDATYLDAVIKETMRNRPVVAQIGRVVTEETEIEGWTVPARTMVIVPMSVLHQDPVAYPEPEAFRPERFLDGEDPGGYSWLPFGGGVRRCPGASLALLEMRTLIATILREVELVADRAEPERPKVRGITIVPSRSCRVQVVRRR